MATGELAKTAVVNTFWNDRPLKTAVRSSFRTAAFATLEIARAGSPSRSVARALNVRFFGPVVATLGSKHPLFHLLELGARAHVIATRTTRLLRTARRSGRTAVRRARGGTGARVLSFKWGARTEGAEGSRGVSGAPVLHPGFGGRFFVRKAAAGFPELYRRVARVQIATRTAAAVLRGA